MATEQLGLQRPRSLSGDMVPSGRGMMRVVSPDELKQFEDEKREDDAALAMPVGELTTYLRRCWSAAQQARMPIEDRMIAAMRQRNGEYGPQKLGEIRQQGGSEIFMMLTSIKCRAAESWIRDIMFQPGDKPWTLKTSPIPDLPDYIKAEIEAEVAQEAAMFQQVFQQMPTPEEVRNRVNKLKDELKQRLEEEAERRKEAMEDKIEDQLFEGEWGDALNEFIKDITTFPAAFLKGPVIRNTRSLQWRTQGGQWKPVVVRTLTPQFYRVSPFDMYPAPNARSLDDGYVIERHRLRRKQLIQMIGVEGFSETAIRATLDDYAIGGLRDWLYNDLTRDRLEQRHNPWLTGADETIDALEFHGALSGKLLRQWGMSEKDVPDESMDYEANCWLIGNHVIRATLNADPLGRRPYHKASYEEIPGAFWGYGVPELMSDLQDVCNAAARSLVNNMAISSGPQVEIYSDRVAPGEDVTQIYPWKLWQMQSDPNGSGANRAIAFYQPDSNAEVLMKVFDFFSKLSDEYTGIPAYTYGNSDVTGAGKTASGLSMLMTAASRGIKQVIRNIDNVVEGSVQRTYEFNMLYDEDESIKGDLNTQARGSASLIAKEQQQIRRNEFLAQTNNPIDFGIMGEPGRAALLREAVKSLDIPVDEVVPDKEAVMAKVQAAMMQAMSQPAGGPGGGPAGPQAQDAAGMPAGGQGAGLFRAA